MKYKFIYLVLVIALAVISRLFGVNDEQITMAFTMTNTVLLLDILILRGDKK